MAYHSKNTTKENKQNHYIMQTRPLIEKNSNTNGSMPILKPLPPNDQSYDIPFFTSNKNSDKKLQDNFQSIINNQKILSPKQKVLKGKQNLQPYINVGSFGTLESKKTLIYPIEHKKQIKQIQSTVIMASKLTGKDPAQKLPSLSPKIPSKLTIRIKQSIDNLQQPQLNQTASKFQQYERKQKQLASSHRFIIPIKDFHIQNDSAQFLAFQRTNCKLWDQIEKLIAAVQRFCQQYDVRNCSIKLQKILQFIKSQKVKNPNAKGFYDTQYKSHQMLDFLQDGQQISQQNQQKKGIRFYGTKGKHRAIIKIQASVKRWLAQLRFEKVKSMIERIIAIQRAYRVYRTYKETKVKIMQKRLEKISKYNLRQKQFQQSYRQRQLTCNQKHQIHVSCHSVSQWQRLSTERYIQKQNSEICRIFRAAVSSSIQTKVIYVSAVPITQQIMSYYFKLFQIGGKKYIRDRIYIISPSIQSSRFSQNFSLTKSLLFSSQTLNRIKKLIKGSYAYIVPSTPSNDYILLSEQLNIPVYSSNPQPLLHLQTKAGNKQIIKFFQKKISPSEIQDNSSPVQILPYSVDIYSRITFLSELTNIIIRNPNFCRWVLKIDDQFNSRGIAYLDVTKILTKSHLQSLRTDNPQKSVGQKQKLYNILQQSIFNNERDTITVLDQKLYQSQQQYLGHFLSKGGIIQPAINNFESQLENICYTIEIQPDNNWRIISNYQKLTVKKKATACYFEPINKQSPAQVQLVVQYLLKKGFYGFFTVEFNRVIDKRTFQGKTSTSLKSLQRKRYFSGIQCSLNEYGSASFLHSFIAGNSYALYIPIIDHPSIKELRMQTFFHLCRLQNISFDIGRKTGNIFLFVDGLETGCMGMLTFNTTSKEDTFVCASQVLDFFGSKLTPSAIKNTPASFVEVRNSINGLIKKQNKKNSTKKIPKQTEYL